MNDDFVTAGESLRKSLANSVNGQPKKRGRQANIKPNAVKDKNPLNIAVAMEASPIKKGKRVKFTPASKLGYFHAPDGYTPRWVNAKDQGNVAKKLKEGWEPVNKTTLPSFEHINEIVAGSDVTESGGLGKGVLRHNEMVAMIMPDELRESRREYYQGLTDRQLKAKLDIDDQKALLGGHSDKMFVNKVQIE